MAELLKFGAFTLSAEELQGCSYRCDPALCRGRVCCAIFDIAITLEERTRIYNLLAELYPLCPWLETESSPFQITPCEIFIKKRENGLCIFNWEDADGNAWCALHTLALQRGENPFKVKPLNCSLWPFLRDGNNQLELDRKTNAPCLNYTSEADLQDPELLNLLQSLE